MTLLISLLLCIALYFLFIRFLSRWKPKRRWFYEAAFVILTLFIMSPYARQLVKMGLPGQEKYIPQGIMNEPLMQLISRKTGITPMLMVLDTKDDYGAYIISRSDHIEVIITKGLLEFLNTEQIGFVVLHEIAHHIKKHHTWRMVLWIAMLILTMGCSWGLYLLSGKYKPLKLWLRLPILYVLVLLLTQPPVLVSRQHEFSADKQAAHWIANPKIGIETLTTLDNISANPTQGFYRFFTQHPTNQERIEALQKVLIL